MSRLHRLIAACALSICIVGPAVRADDTTADATPAKPAPKAKAAPAAGDAAAPAAPAAPGDASATPAPAAPAAPGDATAAPAAPGTPAATAPAAPPAPEINQNQGLRDDVEDFWHYGKVARYDLASAYGKKILGRSEPPLEILQNFESVSKDRGDSLDEWLIRWSTLEGDKGSPAVDLRETSGKLIKLLDSGRYERRKDLKYIQQNVERLASGERGFISGLALLRQSGELAVPVMVDYLRDPKKGQFHDAIRRALIEMGRQALNPLLASTSMTGNDEALITVISALTQIGYDAAVPYLARLRDDQNASASVRSAAGGALDQLGADVKDKNLADLFYALAEKFYYGTAAVTFDPKSPTANLWTWNQDRLQLLEVPSSIFNDLMSMRESQTSLALGRGRADALSLWLAANNKREVDLGSATDPTAPKLTADFYNVDAGAQYVNAALLRSLADHNAAVAVKLIKSLAQIVGPSTLESDAHALIDAMGYADRVVRFEAAFALANALPQHPYKGSEQVVPLLGEAVSQTGVANVLVIAPSQDQTQKIATSLSGYGTAAGTTPEIAIAQSLTLPSVDVIVISEDMGDEQVEHTFALTIRSPRLARSARLVITHSKASKWTEQALVDPLLSTTQATDGPALAKAIEDARRRVGGLPLDDKVATDYALRSAKLLEKLAINHSPAYDLTAAEPQLLSSLSDKRPEVAEAAANVLSILDSKPAQSAILDRALDEKSADDLKAAFYRSLSVSAKNYGSRLNDEQLAQLQKVVEGTATPDVRTAAAQVRGALNLSPDQARRLIVDQK